MPDRLAPSTLLSEGFSSRSPWQLKTPASPCRACRRATLVFLTAARSCAPAHKQQLTIALLHLPLSLTHAWLRETHHASRRCWEWAPRSPRAISGVMHKPTRAVPCYAATCSNVKDLCIHFFLYGGQCLQPRVGQASEISPTQYRGSRPR